jgi:hypothetical protein
LPHADEQMDMKKFIVAFRNFAIAPKELICVDTYTEVFLLNCNVSRRVPKEVSRSKVCILPSAELSQWASKIKFASYFLYEKL